MELRFLRGAPSTLSGNQLVTAASQGADDDGLDHAALADRLGELVERGLVEVAAGLFRMRLDRGHGQAGEAVGAGSGNRLGFPNIGPHQGGRDQRFLAAGFAKQGTQSPSEPALGWMAIVDAHAATLSLGKRPISSRASAM